MQLPLPVLVGGAATGTVFAHIAEFGQGWVPTGGRALADGVPRLRERLAEAGRDPGNLEVIPFLTAAQADHRRIDGLEQAGATEIAFDIQPEDGKAVRGELDRLADLVAKRRALPARPATPATLRAHLAVPRGVARHLAGSPRRPHGRGAPPCGVRCHLRAPYLVKLPASTVIVRPVTYFDSSEARNSTAFAMSSGCTSGVGSRCSDWNPGATSSQVGFSTCGANSA